MTPYIESSTYSLVCPRCGARFPSSMGFQRHSEHCNPEHEAYLDSLVGLSYIGSRFEPVAGIVMGVGGNGLLDVLTVRAVDSGYDCRGALALRKGVTPPDFVSTAPRDGIRAMFMDSCRSYFDKAIRRFSEDMVPRRRPEPVSSHGVTPVVEESRTYRCTASCRCFRSVEDFRAHDCQPKDDDLIGAVVRGGTVRPRYGTVRRRTDGICAVMLDPVESDGGFILERVIRPISARNRRGMEVVDPGTAYREVMEACLSAAGRLFDRMYREAGL